MIGKITNLKWLSDYKGDNVGFEGIDVVGLYSCRRLGIEVLFDNNSGEILEVMARLDIKQ